MEWWEHPDQVWEWFVEKVTVAIAAAMGFDPNGVLPWAQLIAALLAITLSAWGLVNVWNHIDSRRRKLLTAFLDTEEKKILARKSEVAKRFLRPRTSTERVEILDVDANLDIALKLFDAGKLKKADKILRNLQEAIEDRRVIASKQAEVAKKQSGAMLLFRGAMLASQGKTNEAIEQFEHVLKENPDDLDALKYLVEQHLIWAETDPSIMAPHLTQAMGYADQLIEKAGVQYERRADAQLLKGEVQRRQGNPKLAWQAILEARDVAGKSGNTLTLALINERLGTLGESSSLRYWIESRTAYEASLAGYKKLGLTEDANRITEALNSLATRKAASYADTRSKNDGGDSQSTAAQGLVAQPQLTGPKSPG